MILSDVLILSVSQLQTRQVMPSQIRSHIEYLIQTYHIIVLILVNIDKTILGFMAGFNTFNDAS